MVKNYLASALTTLAIGSCFATSAADAPTSNELPSSNTYYVVEMAVSCDGLVIARPRIVMETNKNVELTFNATPAGGAETKLYLHMAPQVSGNTAEAVHLTMKLFDKHNGEWIMRSEPDVYTTLDKEEVLTSGTYGLRRIAQTIGLKFKVSRLK